MDVCGTPSGHDGGRATSWEMEMDVLMNAGAGAQERMSQLYTLHAGPLFRYLLRLTLGDRRETEDALQETFLRSWRQLRHRPLDVQTLRPWLYTVARRVVIDAVRARQARPTDVGGIDMAALAVADDDIERMLTVHAVRSGLMSLRPEHREVLVEVFYRERSVKETAKALGIPEGTVKSRTHYALRALRLSIDVAGSEN